MTDWKQTFKNISLFHKEETITIPTKDCDEVYKYMEEQDKLIAHKDNLLKALRAQLDSAQIQLLETALTTIDKAHKPETVETYKVSLDTRI